MLINPRKRQEGLLVIKFTTQVKNTSSLSGCFEYKIAKKVKHLIGIGQRSLGFKAIPDKKTCNLKGMV